MFVQCGDRVVADDGYAAKIGAVNATWDDGFSIGNMSFDYNRLVFLAPAPPKLMTATQAEYYLLTNDKSFLNQ